MLENLWRTAQPLVLCLPLLLMFPHLAFVFLVLCFSFSSSRPISEKYELFWSPTFSQCSFDVCFKNSSSKSDNHCHFLNASPSSLMVAVLRLSKTWACLSQRSVCASLVRRGRSPSFSLPSEHNDGFKPSSYFENLKSVEVEIKRGSIVSQYSLTMVWNCGIFARTFSNLKGFLPFTKSGSSDIRALLWSEQPPASNTLYELGNSLI